MSYYTSSKHAVDNEIILLREYKASSKSLALFIHGAGVSNQNMLEPICNYLATKGINCASFDFSGHGESSQNTVSSITKKTSQLRYIMELFSYRFEFIDTFAFSMGAQIAINIVDEFPEISNLILFSPALYSTEVFNIPFGTEFTRAIRKHESWKNNNATAKLRRFKGNVHVIKSKIDRVIPRQVLEIYKESTEADQYFEMTFERAPHTLGSWINEDISRFNEIYAHLKKNKTCFKH